MRNKYVNKAKALREQWTSELARAKAEKIKQEATEKALKREQENPRPGFSFGCCRFRIASQPDRIDNEHTKERDARKHLDCLRIFY